MTRENEALDFQVIASPYFHDKEMYTLFSFSDISDEKRRQVLERIFFHDILNTAGGIYGLTDVIQYVDDEKELEEMLKMIHTSSETLVDEIKSQRQLSSAEQGNLVLEYSDLKSFEILKELSELYSQHQIIERRKINIDQSDANVNFSSDKTILKRVLGNMLKNALEASTTDGTVTVKSNKNSDKVLFSVHNSTYMEQDVQLQIFKRSYSTKGSGRGLGTYSIKLLGEKFLKGKVWFESEIEKGTTFYFEIPLTLPDS
jgi:signal transduction histidine kinase